MKRFEGEKVTMYTRMWVHERQVIEDYCKRVGISPSTYLRLAIHDKMARDGLNLLGEK